MRFRVFVVWAAAVAALWTACAPASQARGRGRPLRAPEVVEEEVDAATSFTPVEKLTRMHVKGRPEAVGWLQKAFEPRKGETCELLVSLHGHGADPKGFLYYQMAVRRRCLVLIVAGSTPAGDGYAWSDTDKEYVVGLALHVMENHPVDRRRVILAGHSAGGRMAIVTHGYAPDLWAGLLTTASAGAPTSRQHGVRMVAFLGTQDPNAAMAPTVRSNFTHKRRRAHASLRMVRGLGHEIPDAFYFDQAMDWLLSPHARGGELSLPREPPVKEWKPFAHILLGHREVDGAAGEALRYTPRLARAELGQVKKLLDHRRRYAHILLEAALRSHDERTAASGGLIDLEGLAAFAPELREAAEKLEPGTSSEVLTSPRGFHLVYRFPGEEAEADGR